MRMPGVMMVMMRGHELLYYNICGTCKAADWLRPASRLARTFAREP